MTTPPHAVDDATLVKAAAEGDGRALEQLYDRHAAALLGLARRMLRDEGEAEDLLHDVFMEAYRKAHRYDPSRASVKTWLVIRLRSRALDRLRSARMSRVDSLDAKPSPERFVQTAGNIARKGDHGRLSGRIAELPQEQRVVIELAYFDGLSSTEIAKRLGIPVGTVKSRTRTALRALRRDIHSKPMTGHF